ncbi:MAG: ABC transporter ATP-binding protein [Desulfobulbus sp.]|jgi:iron complex transport system ATP-binding protein|uniref:ABC transporter ATP-binding protein n=1 Tax=Desulfobulbus sp. TaxID=895 RepID=UPI00284C21D9|nr:ABC transporter ATP-binding protein [Desulfobulbus sp.]MDR2549777.1 ABC transporter ATP-binding protein [Desulfobulbus sp.]
MNGTTGQPVIEACDLSVGYKNRPVARDLNFSCHAGQFVSLLGPNGAGKTTLLRTLSRHRPPQGGEIRVQGRPLDRLPALELARIMAVVLTDKIAPPLFTIFEFVALGRYPHTDFLGRLGPKDRVTITSSLAAVHALDLADRPFADLSDGERQKVLVARALAQEPRVLLLDEPTIHLDLKHRVEVMTILRDLCRNKGITVIASLHDVDVAAKVSDRVALIRDGGLVAWGTPETVLSQQAVTALYDFDKAEFNRHLGGIELRGAGDRGRAFVVGGMGSGALVYRMLTKKGFALATGVIHENDLDCFVARSLGAECIAVDPMEPINEAAIDRAKTLMAACDLVVDCGFPVGPVNEANLSLVQAALERGTTVLSLRGELPPGIRVNGGGAPVLCADAGHLIETLETFPFRRPMTAMTAHDEELRCNP